MAIGTAAAIGIGLMGAGSAASALSGNAASRRAAQTSQQATDSNNALARDIYGQNRQIMSPFVNRGNAAGNQINALLGLGGAPMEQGGPAMVDMGGFGQFQGGQPAGAAYGIGDSAMLSNNMGGGVNWGAYVAGNPDAAANWNAIRNTSDGAQFGGDVNAFGQFHFNADGGQRDLTPFTAGASQVPQQGGQTPQQAATNAFDIFKQSTGFQNRFNSAMDGVSSAFAGAGGFQSGAAMKALQDRAGQVAGDEFANYMNALGAQQAVGAGSASSLAGVGQNFAGTVIGQNSMNAQNQMSAQLGRQNPLANMLGTVGGAGLGFLSGGR
jgi:hypothetical protein